MCVCRIPFYFFVKVGFLVWCYHPSTVVRELQPLHECCAM